MKKDLLLHEAAAAYPFGKDITSLNPYGGGHINDTFLAVCSDGTEYVLQHINSYVFKRPDQIMENIMGITKFIADKLIADGEFWRVTLNIPNTTAYDFAESASMLEKSGAAFGNFQRMLADYPAETLHETIPHFHDTPDRYRQLEDAIQNNAAGRLEAVSAEIEFVKNRKADCAILMDLLAKGELPLKVTHNDTKMSNVLIDNTTGDAVCVIDLDTVMPGLTAFDYGDSIRAGATTAAEDEVDLTKVHFSLDLYKAYTAGFLRTAGSALTETEIRTLPVGAKLMTLEVGMRFLADYLNGDVYFKTKYPQHNLDRARNQFHLVEEMEQQWADMMAVVEQYL